MAESVGPRAASILTHERPLRCLAVCDVSSRASNIIESSLKRQLVEVFEPQTHEDPDPGVEFRADLPKRISPPGVWSNNRRRVLDSPVGRNRLRSGTPRQQPCRTP